MTVSYYTIGKDGSAEHLIQKSRFIGYAKRTETEAAAQEFIREIKKKHHNATHNCSAYLIGEFDQIQKANDDGEPGGTAGIPMLEVLKKRKLKNVTVVVTRYFGGVKLGAGGLIRAYSSTTSLVLDTIGIVKRQVMQKYEIKADYSLLGFLQNEIKNSEFHLHHIDYESKVVLSVFVESGKEESFNKWMVNLTNDQVLITAGDKIYAEIKINQ